MSVAETTVRTIANGTELSESKLDQIEGLLAAKLDDDDLSNAMAVKHTFLAAVEEFPNINVTDLWNYGLYRSYLSLVDGSEASARQSWRAVSGAAFEHFVVEYYNQRLPRYLRVAHVTETEVADVINSATSEGASDVVDAVVLGRYDGEWHAFAGINTLTSFKGRLRNYAARSDSLRKAGLSSFVVTLDGHIPEATVQSRGELGSDQESTAANLVEEHAMFDGLFSFNDETNETTDPTSSASIKRVGDTRFNDAFAEDVTAEWEEFVAPLMQSRSLRVDE